jgi:hypothetical protein
LKGLWQISKFRKRRLDDVYAQYSIFSSVVRVQNEMVKPFLCPCSNLKGRARSAGAAVRGAYGTAARGGRRRGDEINPRSSVSISGRKTRVVIQVEMFVLYCKVTIQLGSGVCLPFMF